MSLVETRALLVNQRGEPIVSSSGIIVQVLNQPTALGASGTTNLNVLGAGILLWNGTTWHPMRDVMTASGSTGGGVLGVGSLLWNDLTWHPTRDAVTLSGSTLLGGVPGSVGLVMGEDGRWWIAKGNPLAPFVQGPVANGGAAGNPHLVGFLNGSNISVPLAAAASSDALATTGPFLQVIAAPHSFNLSSLERNRSVMAASGQIGGTGIPAAGIMGYDREYNTFRPATMDLSGRLAVHPPVATWTIFTTGANVQISGHKTAVAGQAHYITSVITSYSSGGANIRLLYFQDGVNIVGHHYIDQFRQFQFNPPLRITTGNPFVAVLSPSGDDTIVGAVNVTGYTDC